MDSAADASSAMLGKAPARLLRGFRRDYLVGIGLLLVVVFLWTASNFVTQVRTTILKTGID